MYDLKHPRPLNNAGPCLQELIRSGPDDVKCCALETVGNLAFPPDNRSKFLAAPAFHELLCRMAGRGVGLVQQRVCTAAIRALAILGELARL